MPIIFFFVFVQTTEDRAPESAHYRRYKEIKRLLAAQLGGSDEL